MIIHHRVAEETVLTRVVSSPVPTAESVAELYVSAMMGSGSPVSTASAIRTLRTLLSDCKLSDHDLATLVAQAAIAEGLDVSFDGPEEQGFLVFRKT